MLSHDPGPGISAWSEDHLCLNTLSAQIVGPEGSPYEGGVFTLKINIPHRYF